MDKEQYTKHLRQRIMASAVTKGWDSETFHALMEEWGYGNSLRKLRIEELKDVQVIVNGGSVTKKDYGAGTLDAQGKYMWALMKEADWDWERVRKLMLSKYKATHWNALKADEKRGIINILKSYAKKEMNNG